MGLSLPYSSMNSLFNQMILVVFLQAFVSGFSVLPCKRVSRTSCDKKGFRTATTTLSPILRLSRDWIDEVEYVDDDDEDEERGPPPPPDMKYIPRNVMRQHQNFVAIRQAGGKELTNDIYIREPNSDVFWFIGKAARVSDVTMEQAVSRQWSLIEMHGASLRPIELFPGRGSLEIWTAPGDSEMEVAYNNPHLVFTKMERAVPGAQGIKNALIGFQGEMYQRGEEGFRTWRTEEGRAAKPQIQSPTADEVENQIDDEDMKKIEEMLQGQDINEVYKEQQRRAGNPVDD